jgi:serine/threonine protein phosphatase 1
MSMTGDLTEGHRIYAVGDIHGRLDLLSRVVGRIRADLSERPHPRPLLIFLGDYVDRGPQTRGVLETLIGLQESDLPTGFMLGNHDRYVQDYIRAPDWYDRTYHWLSESFGGASTLASYGVTGVDPMRPAEARDAFAAVFPARHLAFLDSCMLWIRRGGYLFVHAGIRPGVPLAAQDPEDLVWIREPFLLSRADFGFKVVHGHTIVRTVEHHPNRIAIDTGAVRTGMLSCLVLEGTTVSLLASEGLRPCPVGTGVGGWRSLWKRR